MPKKIKAKKSKRGIDNLDTAYKCFKCGNLQECERICKQILLMKPDHPDTLHLLGLVAYQSGQINEAINNFRRAVKLNPQVYFYHNNLGLALDAQGLKEEAIDCYKKTIKLKPDFAKAYNNLGIALAKKGMTDDAIQNFNTALSLTPDNAEIYFNLGMSLADRGMVNEAIDNYRKALAVNPHYSEAYNQLGFLFKDQGMLDKAIENFKKTLDLNPDFAQGYNNIGNVFSENNMQDEAIDAYKKALELKPDYAEAYYNLGNALSEKNMQDEAIETYKKALELKPDYAEAYYNLGNALSEKNMREEAVEKYRKALELKPDFTDAYVNIGIAFIEEGLTDEAINNFKKALMLDPEYAKAYHNLGVALANRGMVNKAVSNYQNSLMLKPDYAETHKNLGIVYLLSKDFDKGWKEYEWRLLADKNRVFSGVRWDGSYLNGKTLLIHAEQGVGDEIMFASCLTDVLSLEGNYMLECDGRLMPLFRRSFPGITVIRRSGRDERQSEFMPQTDFHIYAGSLPLHFRPDLSSFPQHRSYLIPDEQKVEIWRAKLKKLGEGLKVGIAWRGGLKANIKLTRSISLEQWYRVFSLQGIHFINLQYGDCVKELKEINDKTGVTIHDWDYADPLKDLDGFAAQIAALALVISVDNSTVHMAGAIGVPVWTLLPDACDWRWMQDFEDTPWYESVRLYRQRSFGDWESVLKRVETHLRDYVTTGVMPEIEHGNSYKNTGEGGGESISEEATKPLSFERGDETYKCAIITPVGPGHEGLYEECLASINKSYDDNKGRFSEIILVRVDDTDGRLGRSRARNKGIKQAAEQGAEWLFFLDADDLMAPSAFEYASNYLDDYDAVWGSIWSIEEGQQKAEEREGQLSFLWSIEDVLSFDPFVSLQMGHFVKTSVALSALFDESLDTGEDFDYYLRVWEKHKCIKIPLPFFYNRRGIHSQGPRSATGGQWRQVVEGIIKKYRER